MPIHSSAKICIVSPSLKLGGIERALTTLANEFQVLGHEIHFIACLKDDHFYQLSEEVKIYEPYFKRTNSKVNKWLFYPNLLNYIRTTVNKVHPDRVLVFGDWFSPITLLALLGTPYQVYISDRTIPNYKFRFPIPQMKKWLYPQSAGFIAQTQRAKDFKVKQFGDQLRIALIPNAQPGLEGNNSNVIQRANKILYVGRFAWEKDPEILIKAMQYISIKFPDWQLDMAGTGPLLDPMKMLAKKLNLESKVTFLGKISDVGSLYSSCSILVLPSIVEGFPNTLIEGMSFGLPCVCFKEIPHEDIITHNVDGLIVNERKPELLAECIEKLIVNEGFRKELGINAKVSVNRFEKSEIAQKVLRFMKL